MLAHVEVLPVSLPRLRAPKEHGQILAVPPLDQVGALLDHNHRLLNAIGFTSDTTLEETRKRARQEVLAASTQYHAEAGESVPPATGDYWLVAGHQPELFHPGVWFKNFALHQLAQRHRAVALNLIIDTDAAKPARLHVPDEGRLARVAFDRSNIDTPYEERTVEDEDAFASLPQRLAPVIGRWKFEPLLETFWAEVMKQAGRTPLLGERLAAGRRALERRWGVVQLEVPMSRVCQTEAFARFAVSLVEWGPGFFSRYCYFINAYRKKYGIRSKTHPFPLLDFDKSLIDGGVGFVELPFWAWRRGKAQRGRLYCRQSGAAMLLRVNGEEWPSIPLGNRDAAVEIWRSLEERGYKVRPRALVTTLFARLYLADVFVHGIGGGIYDEVTDQFFTEWFEGTTAPNYLVLSATLQLPLPRFPHAAQQVRDLKRRMRDLTYNPDRFVPRRPEIDKLVGKKRQWIGHVCADHAERVERFQRLRALNASLLPEVQPQLSQARRTLEEAHRQAAWDAIAGRRDYAFCLYPEEMLRTFFTDPLNL